MIRTTKNLRSRCGTTIAEFGPTLMLAFAVVVFPMVAFGMIGLRYVLLLNANEMAAEQAAKSENFLADAQQIVNGTTQYSLSAVHKAQAVAQMGCQGIGNGSVQWGDPTVPGLPTNVYVYSCPMGGTTLTTPGANKPLAAAANATANTYNCVVVTNTVLQPIFPGARGMIGAIPGFNAGIHVTVTSSRYFENTANLNN